MKSHLLGTHGEAFAKDYLRAHGYEIIGTNIHSPNGEIDCLCKLKAAIVCMEVKTRSRGTMGSPYDAVNALKRYKIMQTAYFYLQTHHITYSSIQIDIISLVVNPNGTVHELKHFKNVHV